MRLSIGTSIQNAFQTFFGPQTKSAQHCGSNLVLNDTIKPDPELINTQLKSEPTEAMGSLSGQNSEEHHTIDKKDSSTQTNLLVVAPNMKRKWLDDDGSPWQKYKKIRKELKEARKQGKIKQVSNRRSHYVKPKGSGNIQSTALHTPRRMKNRGVVNFIMFEYPDDTPIKILSRTANDHHVKLQYKLHRNEAGHVCTVIFNNAQLAQAVGRSSEEAKINAATLGVHQLQKYDYTIKVLDQGSKLITKRDFESLSKERTVDRLGHDNIGFKIMTSMGWSNTEGLGKSSQGIVEPIIPVQKFKRGGIGSEHNEQTVFVQKCMKIFEDYIREDELEELEFCSFTNEEMGLIEYAAQKIGLCTKRAGPKVNRTVRVMRIKCAREKLNLLLKLGGSLGRYQLIHPTVRHYYQ